MNRTLPQIVLALSLALAPVPVRSQSGNTLSDDFVQLSEKSLQCGTKRTFRLTNEPPIKFPRYTLFFDQDTYFVFDDENNNGVVDDNDSAGFRDGIAFYISKILYIKESRYTSSLHTKEGRELLRDVLGKLRNITCHESWYTS